MFLVAKLNDSVARRLASVIEEWEVLLLEEDVKDDDDEEDVAE